MPIDTAQFDTDFDRREFDEADIPKPPQILIIDDDAELLNTVHDMLLPYGFDIKLAKNGVEAASLYRSERIDLAIMDILMPQKDGFETLMEIRRHSPFTRVLAISGGGNLGLVQVLAWAQRLGADGVLAKPFSAEELFQSVSKLLATKPKS